MKDVKNSKKKFWTVIFASALVVSTVTGCAFTKNDEEMSVRPVEESYENQADGKEGAHQESSEKMIEEMGGTTAEAQVNIPVETNELQVNPIEEIPRMVQVKGEIYYDTGVISNALRCGVMDGEITTTVSEEETPTKDNQSNFGSSYGYQYCGRKVIHVNIEEKWHVFQASEAYRLTVTKGDSGELVELERGPEFWNVIEKYNSIEANKAENQEARVGYTYCLRLYDEEDNLLSTVTPLQNVVQIDDTYYVDNSCGNIAELFLALDALYEEETAVATASETAIEPMDTLANVSMYVTYATDKGANIIFYNDTDKNMQFGDDYELQMRKGEEWYQVDYIIDNAAFHDIAYGLPKGEPVSWSVKWTYFHGILPAGDYRIVKEVMDFRGTGDYTKYRLAAEFRVENHRE